MHIPLRFAEQFGVVCANREPAETGEFEELEDQKSANCVVVAFQMIHKRAWNR